MERKRREREAAERVQMEHRMAVRLQSWWRMLMVVKGMGQFRRVAVITKKASTVTPGSGRDLPATQGKKSNRSVK